MVEIITTIADVSSARYAVQVLKDGHQVERFGATPRTVVKLRNRTGARYSSDPVVLMREIPAMPGNNQGGLR